MSNKNALPGSVPAWRGARKWGVRLLSGTPNETLDMERTGGFLQAIGWKPPELCSHSGLNSAAVFHEVNKMLFPNCLLSVSLLIPSPEAGVIRK